ncbi:hypothetical protein C8Q74DRAFT_1252489 [Fomes fomentarius]|nr:hypothetical protein C8Q74DRAFT_1252489 [Fomes fomentarius]
MYPHAYNVRDGYVASESGPSHIPLPRCEEMPLRVRRSPRHPVCSTRISPPIPRKCYREVRLYTDGHELDRASQRCESCCVIRGS